MTDVKVKKEVNLTDPAEIENRIKELCQQFPHGITDQVIQNDLPHLEPQQRAMALNKLLSLGQLDLLRNSSGLLYRMKDTQTSGKMKGSDNQEKLVYQVIEDAGNKGIWSRDSKQSPMVQRNSSFATSHEVWKYISELGISKVDLSMDDIETILNTLIYDGKVEMTVIAAKEGTVGSVDGQMKLYRGVNAIIHATGLVKTPCGLCPVFDDCHEGGEISPSNCIYMSEWLDF
ncbi:DNA-directed RNA polymerase III subunit RPC6 [Solea senegalensis]|uniref:DNA-directed RNA polymerase III subunit RPC6 n=1 Tax=Solea senegalensis TaxID=28829 RepID=A0AAV6QAQ7_SOLSE|nr:DNA-directed RNA polymerase III subunit RPC6 [Solea senegalensis]